MAFGECQAHGKGIGPRCPPTSRDRGCVLITDAWFFLTPLCFTFLSVANLESPQKPEFLREEVVRSQACNSPWRDF